MAKDENAVFRAWIKERDPHAAVSQLIDGVGTDHPSLTLVFADPDYDLDGLAVALRDRVHGPILACTTAGEIIGEEGYQSHGLSVAAIKSSRLSAHVFTIRDVKGFGPEAAQQFSDEIRRISMDVQEEGEGADQQFGVLLVDGMSHSEEHLTALIHGASGGVHLVGGSAGDAGKFAATHVFDGERFLSNTAVYAQVTTSMPHKLFRFQHFEPTGDRLVVTKADPKKRLLLELNGEPARKVYCEHIGHAELDQNIVASHPLLLKCSDEYYARSIRAWDDEKLTLFCAIEAGMVIRIGAGRDLVRTLATQLDELTTGFGGRPILTVSFDCILRRKEVQKIGGEDDFRAVMANHPIVGFSTYGEQFDGLHINQTMTGFSIAA